MAFANKLQALGGDFLGKSEDLGFDLARQKLGLASKAVSQPANAPTVQTQFVPVPVTPSQSAGFNLTPQMMVLIAGGFVLLIVLLKK